jgi:hypothetical protein
MGAGNSSFRYTRRDLGQGGGCPAGVRRSDTLDVVGSMSMNIDDVEVRLRIPTSLGAFSSSTCHVDQFPGGRAYAPLRVYGQAAAALSPTELVVLEDGPTGFGGRVSSDCNWPRQAIVAAGFVAENGAHMARDVGEQVLTLNGAGPWELGEPSYWVTQSESVSEVFSSRGADNCWGLVNGTNIHRTAEWDLPAQTHTFLPPEP